MEWEAQQTEGHVDGADPWDFSRLPQYTCSSTNLFPVLATPVTDSPFLKAVRNVTNFQASIPFLGLPPPLIRYKSFSHITVL